MFCRLTGSDSLDTLVHSHRSGLLAKIHSLRSNKQMPGTHRLTTSTCPVTNGGSVPAALKTEFPMFPGLVTFCLNVKDLAGMRHFYEALGLKVHIDQPSSVLLNNGDVDIALMTFLDEPCLNFRGADPFEMHDVMTTEGLQLEGKPEQYKKEKYNADADGRNWITRDPDGNNVFFDTNEGEIGPKGNALALQRVLDATAKQLINVGASDACCKAFRSKVLDVYMPLELGRKRARASIPRR